MSHLEHPMIKAMVCLLMLWTAAPAPADSALISRHDVVDDIRTLTRTIENVHPDPYLRGGGKIAFHRRVETILQSVPDSGMTADDLYTLVAPLAAAAGDGHTAVSDPHDYDVYAPGGIPLYFDVACEGLIVMAVLRDDHREFIGSRLLSVAGVPVDTLLLRLAHFRAADNRYQLLSNLGKQGALWKGHTLRLLIPTWKQSGSITVELGKPDGTIVQPELEIPDRIDFASFIMAPTSHPELLSRYMTQAQRSDLFYFFPDSARQTCVLAIRSMNTYREAFEAWQSLGVTNRTDQARGLYQRYHGTAPPESAEEVIAGLPSATELLTALARDMDSAGTRTLIIDLSQNDGGSSLITNILLYFIYGRDALLSLKGRSSEIVKYSCEYFDIYPSPGLDDLNDERPVALQETDYDFAADYGFFGYPGLDRVSRDLERTVDLMPTFAEVYRDGRGDGIIRPERVMVLCDAGTYSAAFWAMFYLKQAGAEICGVPSAQAGNCFGDILQFELPNSKLKYTVSRKYFELFPGDPENGQILMPDHPLTHDQLAGYGFDPFSLLWHAMELTQR
jgi:hypothetical protein